MWHINREQYSIGPFLFTSMGDPSTQSPFSDVGCGKLLINCRYDSQLSDDFVAIRPSGNSDFIAVVHKDNGNMNRPWFDRHGNPWAKLFASDSRIGLLGLLAVEVSRHWLEEATGYELQHIADETYTKIQGWFLGKQEDY